MVSYFSNQFHRSIDISLNFNDLATVNNLMGNHWKNRVLNRKIHHWNHEIVLKFDNCFERVNLNIHSFWVMYVVLSQQKQ